MQHKIVIKKDVCIIGGGPAGIWAISQCGILGLTSVIVEGLDVLGGQCMHLYPQKNIYDIPGNASISGEKLIRNLLEQAEYFNPEILLGQDALSLEIIKNSKVENSSDSIESKQLTTNNTQDDEFHITTSAGKKIVCKAIIIATGAGKFEFRKIPLQKASILENKSVFYSVTDIEKFRDKRILITGGGNSAIDWARDLSGISHVTLAHRRDTFSAAASTVQHVTSHKNVIIMTPYTLHDIHAHENEYNIKKVELRHLESSEIHEIEVDFILAFFGLTPVSSAIDNWGLQINSKNKLITNIRTCETSINMIFAIGDSSGTSDFSPIELSKPAKLILTGFDEATQAIHEIYRRIYPDNKIKYSTNNISRQYGSK
jgi:thioredoxin reductase (NADPH)